MSLPSLLGVVPEGAPSFFPAQKRKITPSADESSPNRALIVTSPGQNVSDFVHNGRVSLESFRACGRLFPRGVAVLARHYEPNPLYNPTWPPTVASMSAEPATTVTTTSPQPVNDYAWNVKHVILPFDLRSRKVDVLEGDAKQIVGSVFPGIEWISQSIGHAYLSFTVTELPTGPWPLTIGGIPHTISTKNEGRGPLLPRQDLGNLSLTICPELDVRLSALTDDGLRQLARRVSSELEQCVPGFPFSELIVTAERLIYVVLRTGPIPSRRILPGRIGKYPTGYMLEKDLNRPAWNDRPVKRLADPNPKLDIVDNTAYDVIRPGVLVSSNAYHDHGHPATYLTTSGIFVRDNSNETFITGATHGIGEDEIVYQPGTTGLRRAIGRAEADIACTDVSLISLFSNVKYAKETFEDELGGIPRFTRLFGEDPDEVLGDFAQLRMNSPYTGNIEGCFILKSAKLEMREGAPRYVIYNWLYTGQEEGAVDRFRPPEGTCGSAIWNDEGVITGFFHFYIAEGSWAGFCASVSASEVVRAGYRLA